MLNAFRQHHNRYYSFITALLLVHLPLTTQAHEFWIEPTHYMVEHGEPIVARLKVGQKLVGAPQVYLPQRFEAFNLSNGDDTQAVTSRMGNDPAVNQTAATQGLHILSYISTDSNVTYEDAATFTKFLKAEGIDWVLAAHKQRGLPEQGFTEAYQRFAKSLVQIGQPTPENSNDRALGLRFELIAEKNPYSSDQAIPIRLEWQGKPFTDAHINVFRRHNGTLSTAQLRTDQDGRALLEHQPGDYLLNAVHMIDPTDTEDTATANSVVWKSLWASLTFQIPDTQ